MLDQQSGPGTVITAESVALTKGRRIGVWIAIALSALAVAMIIFVSTQATQLRPIADDNSLGADARQGIFAAAAIRWRTWSGDITGVLVNLTLVGWPVIHLPWQLASALPFMIAAGVVAALCCDLVRRCAGEMANGSTKPIRLVLLLPVFMVSWWAYWWINAIVLKGDTKAMNLSLGITFWQNLNSGYVITPLAITWLYVALEQSCKVKRGLIRLAGYGLLGLAIGTSGVVFASAAVVTAVVLRCGSLLGGRGLRRSEAIGSIALVTTALVGIAVSHLSPGTRSRALHLPSPKLDWALVHSLMTAMPEAMSNWWTAIASPGAVVAGGFICGITVLSAPALGRICVPRLLSISTSLLAFSLTLALVSRAGQFFAYVAWWHEIGFRTFAFVGLMAISVAVGSWMATLLGPSAVRAGAAVCLVGSLLVYPSLLAMTRSMQERLARWEAGPAPIGSIADIEVNWVRDAWRKVAAARDSPIRGLE